MELKRSITQFERQPIEDHCGIVAAFSSHDIPFFTTGLKGLSILQTRGYDGAGFWAMNHKHKTFEHKGEGMIYEVFNPDIVKKYVVIPATTWIYQVRYGTFGGFNSQNVQPIVGKHTDGSVFCVAHNGQFSKTKESENSDLSDTALFVKELEKTSGDTWDERIQRILQQKRGAWSLIIGTAQTLYLARDSFGFRPLAYGHLLDKNHNRSYWVVASETSALEQMGVEDFFEVMPGTITKITAKGMEVMSKTVGGKRAMCVFENIYIQHGAGKAHLPRTSTRQINKSPTIDDIRRRTGRILAREAPLTKNEVDMVIGVPGTGIEGGMMFARALDLPYFQAITDKIGPPQEQRTFMSAKIETIYDKVLNHFNFDAQTLKNRRVVLVDDSIVRGNITKGLVRLLKDQYHVLAVHLRILSPAIDKVCHLGVNTRSNKELIAATYFGDVEKIRQAITADSLVYISAGGLKEALTGDMMAKGFCMGCMVGQQYPIDTYGNLLKQKVKKRKVSITLNKNYSVIPVSI